MEKILVATDFSTAAQNALEYAVEMAKITKSKIVLYHVNTPPTLPVTDLAWSVLPETIELREDSLMNLKKQLKEVALPDNLAVEYYTEEGLPVEKIIEFVKKEKFKMIVMGMKKAGSLTEFLIGSVATSVLKKSSVPVLLVPELFRFKKPSKIVFACDYDIKHTVILNPLKKLVNAFDAQLMVLHIKDRLELVDAQNTIAVNKLEVALKNTVRSFHTLEDGNLVHGLKKFVELHQADMVVTIAHRHNFIESVFRRDHNKNIAFHSAVPLFCIPDNHKDVAAYFV